LESFINRGATGSVWKARKTGDALAVVAIKVFFEEPEDWQSIALIFSRLSKKESDAKM